MKDIKLLVSSILIILSFFLGLFFGKIQSIEKIKSLEEKKESVKIDIVGKKIKVIGSNKNIDIIINGEYSSSGEIIME